jgi:hypothetical protein
VEIPLASGRERRIQGNPLLWREWLRKLPRLLPDVRLVKLTEQQVRQHTHATQQEEKSQAYQAQGVSA